MQYTLGLPHPVFLLLSDRRLRINIFHHPNPATSVFGDYVSTEIYGDPTHFRANPREGNLILFPSHILHEATPVSYTHLRAHET